MAAKRDIRIQDLSEIVVGSAMLAFPMTITSDVWSLGETLPVLNIVLIVILSLVFVGWFNYHARYQSQMNTHKRKWTIRVLITYAVTLFVSASILALPHQFPLSSDSAVAIKRMIIVAAPASSVATILDYLR